MTIPVEDLKGNIIGHLSDAGDFIPMSPANDCSHDPIKDSPIKDTDIKDTSIIASIDRANDCSLDGPANDCSLDQVVEKRASAPANDCSLDGLKNPPANDCSPDGLAPAPVGDDLDDLILESAKTFLTFPRLKGHIAGNLNREKYVPSQWFIEELMIWIERGNLRRPSQVNDALARFCDYQERLIAFTHQTGATEKWELSAFNIQQLRWHFGVPDARPLPTKAEVIANRSRLEAEQEQRRLEGIKEAAEDKKREQQMEIEVALNRRKKDLLTRISKAFYTQHGISDAEYASDPLGPTLTRILERVRTFQKFNRALVNDLVDAGKTDDEIIEEMREMTAIQMRAKSGVVWESSAFEPVEGETYLFVEPEKAVTECMRLVEGNPAKEVAVQLMMDGRILLSVRPQQKNGEQHPASAQEATAPAGDSNQKDGHCAA